MLLKKTLMFAAVAILSLTTFASADVLRVLGESIQLTSPDSYFMQPIWSPMGDRLAVAGRNYEGLWTVQREGGEPQQISDMIGAGYLPVWDPDGTRLACRVSQMENKRKFSAIAVYDLDKATSTELTEYQKEVGLPQWTDGGRKLFYLEDGEVCVAEAPGATKSEGGGQASLVFLRGAQIVLYDWLSQQETILQPVEGDILWAEFSPDGRYIVFEELGAELYVVNADGTGLVSLGRGERPRWSPDGQWIVYMITLDDGHRMLSADIYAIHRSGNGKAAVTQTPDRLEMNPHWSPDGGMIAYDTRGEGLIFLIPVGMERSYPPQR